MAKLTITNDKKSYEMPSGTRIVEYCDKNNTAILFGCRSASCGTCMIQVVDGMNHLSPKGDKEKDLLEMVSAGQHERLACQCSILGDVTVTVPD
jgi:ferredoxin